MSSRMSFKALLVFGILSLAASGAAAKSPTGSFEQSYTADGPVRLDVSTGSGSIDIRSGDTSHIEIIGKIKVRKRSFLGLFKRSSKDMQEIVDHLESSPPVSFENGVLLVGHIKDKAVRRKVSISYEIVVPANSEVKSHTGSGSQSITDVLGPVVVKTGSGRITLTNIGDAVNARSGSGAIRADNIAGAFEAHAGSGSIRLTQTAPGDVIVSTGSGSSELRGVVGSLNVHAGSGRIVVDGQQDGDWLLDTGSGSVTIDLPSDAAFSLDAESGSGGITVDHPLTVQGKISKRHIRGDVRGGGDRLRIDTGSGGIHVN